MIERGWIVIGEPPPARHAFRVTMRLPWLTTALCSSCGLFYSSGDPVRGLFFRRVKPRGFLLDDASRYVDTTEEPADCYAMASEESESRFERPKCEGISLACDELEDAAQ